MFLTKNKVRAYGSYDSNKNSFLTKMNNSTNCWTPRLSRCDKQCVLCDFPTLKEYQLTHNDVSDSDSDYYKKMADYCISFMKRNKNQILAQKNKRINGG